MTQNQKKISNNFYQKRPVYGDSLSPFILSWFNLLCYYPGQYDAVLQSVLLFLAKA